jgi:hypothetical protein
MSGINIIMIEKQRKGPKWKTGPNPLLHEKFECWHKARAQARFRGEPWDLTFEQWVEVWGINWNLRGRGAHDLCMTRRDPSEPWNPANAILIERSEHCRRHNDNMAKRAKRRINEQV